jgi:ABC-type branched-subunit amino acid transport system substrate-binding protein
VFVADTADRLELIAPQLAAFDLVVVPPGSTARPPKGRHVLLLSMAEGLRPKFVRGAGRYCVGAVFAPGFYPDDTDPVIGPYAVRYRAAYGEDPTYLDAYAYDAVLAIRAALGAGATTRSAVATGLAGVRFRGLTGEVRFDAAHDRADAGLLYTVTTDSGGPAIRVRR